MWFFLVTILASRAFALPTYKQGFGSLFIKEATIHTSNHAWTISYNLNIHDYLSMTIELASRIDDYIVAFDEIKDVVPPNRPMSKSFSDLYYNEYVAIEETLRDTKTLQVTVQNLTRVCFNHCSSRRRRSLLPLGSLFSFLFGVASESHQQLIKERVQHLEDSQLQVAHYVENAMTVVNKASDDIILNRMLISNLTDVMTQMTHSYNRTLNVVENMVIPYQRVSYRILQLSLAKQAFQHCYLQLAQQVYALELKVSDVLSGRITPELFPPALLHGWLRNIKFKFSQRDL